MRLVILVCLLLLSSTSFASDFYCSSERREFIISNVDYDKNTAIVAYSLSCLNNNCWKKETVNFDHNHDAYSDFFVFNLSTSKLYLDWPRDDLDPITSSIIFTYENYERRELLNCHY